MPAEVIQTNKVPFEKVDLDPITLDIIESALKSARYEMDAVLYRTAMSPGIREQHDEFPMIANPDGDMVVGQFGSFMHGFKRRYDGTIEEGDIFLTSDPYSCAGAISHANDWLIMRPIYFEGRLISYAAMFGHMTDVGGKTPGSLPTDANQIFEEGVRVPITKIYKDDVLQEDVLKVILHQCRLPHWNKSDFNALIAGTRLAERRVLELCERFGVDTLFTAMDELLERNRRAMLHLIRETVGEDERLYFEDYICDDGIGMGPYKMACTMWREGDKLIFDFDGTDPQSPSSINFLLNEEMFKMFVGVYMINVFDPQIMFNDGFYEYVDVRIPPGTMLKPLEPAALSSRTHALGRIFDVIGGLLGQRAPDFMVAAGFSDSPHFFYSGHDRNGEWYQLYQIGFGGIPGRPVGDGPDGHSLWPSFTNVPNEFLEAYFPLRIEAYETIPDSGGAGLHRGGNGVRISYRALEPGEMSLHDDRWLTYPWGVNGGEPGGRSTKILERTDGSTEIMPSKCDHVKVNEGDIMHFCTWGGGGWGDPYERDPALLALELDRGLVTAKGALRYGVVLNADGKVDEAGTDALREKLRGERTEISLFNRGGELEELRARCKEETGLEPPVAPVFREHVVKALREYQERQSIKAASD
ncbi:MAG: hydantoinase B/oxoprolinase family protein [Alphaproteobacteria bacterium]|jgi:N-methylhydantoinase B|nr:hydantoinase B/oxoprolinase family protein [Alphaproteobacteria bacterium]